MFADLLAHPGVDERRVLGSPIGFMAIHGGIEEGTVEVATEAARRSGASLYAVVLPDDLWWHVPSRLIRPTESPVLAEFLDHVAVAVSIHGYGRAGLFTSVLLGGRNRELAGHLRDHLAPLLPDYDLVDDLERIPPDLRGLHPDNPVNGPARGGVQVELPPRIRGMGPFWDVHDSGAERAPHTEALIHGLAEAAREGALHSG